MPPDTWAWTLTALMLRFVLIWLRFQLANKESGSTVLTWTHGSMIIRAATGVLGRLQEVSRYGTESSTRAHQKR
jgi:hypothetical protein